MLCSDLLVDTGEFEMYRCWFWRKRWLFFFSSLSLITLLCMLISFDLRYV